MATRLYSSRCFALISSNAFTASTVAAIASAQLKNMNAASTLSQLVRYHGFGRALQA